MASSALPDIHATPSQDTWAVQAHRSPEANAKLQKELSQCLDQVGVKSADLSLKPTLTVPQPKFKPAEPKLLEPHSVNADASNNNNNNNPDL